MRSFFGKLFQKPSITEQAIDPMKKFLIVGLGNIGPKYTETRHNIGFKVVDAFAKAQETSFETDKLGAIARTKVKGKTVVLLKPNTFMNLSGKAIRYWLQQEKIPVENLLVITDDLNLEFGTIRVKMKGSAGGHNGLKDTQAQLNTSVYNRFRFGISDAFSTGRQVDYVLGEWTPEEQASLPERLDRSCEVITSFVSAGINNTMNAYNGK